MATYTVKKGDTLSAIAKQYGTTYQEIAKANGISDPNYIRVGQVLNINGSSNTETTDSTATTTPTTDATPDAVTPDTKEVTAPKFDYGEYAPSDAVNQAQQMLNQQLSQKPGEYQSSWQTQLNDTLQKILNREKFSYDLNADALYQQYKDQFTTQGKMAMMDTMGQAQAMTGGYGNSYAQSVGQQAYQGHLQQLNDKIPELYQLALNKYQMEGNELKDQYGMMAQQEELDYGRYRDQLGDWQTERDYLSNRYDTERDYDYSKWANGRDFAYDQFADDRAYDYQVGRDKVTDEQWQKEFEEAKRQFDQQMGLKSGTSGGGSSGGSSGGGGSKKSSGSTYSSGSYTANPGLSKSEILSIQKQAGITQDGIWGAQTAAAYDKGVRPKKDAGGVPTNYAELSKYLASVSSGSSKQDLSKDINSALAAGIINQNQAQQLLKAYAPRGYTK